MKDSIARFFKTSPDNPDGVSMFRLYLMRALYLLIFVGEGSIQWPALIGHPIMWSFWHGVGSSLLAAMTLMMALGIRYPLQMLPLLLFELLWKSLWLIAIALPLWRAGQMDADTQDTVTACLMGVVLCPLVIPWSYVLVHYVKQRGDRWR